MTFLLTLLARWGVPERLRGALAWALATLSALALLWALVSAYDRQVIARHEQKQTQQSVKALDDAAEQRAIDAVADALSEKEQHDVIEAAPTDNGLSDADLALNCLRLRKLGREPPACKGH